MKEKIENLIQHHKEACQELQMLIGELHEMGSKLEDSDGLIEKYSQEYTLRKVFLGQLEDIT